MKHMSQKRNSIDYELLLALSSAPSHARGLAKSLHQSPATAHRRLTALFKQNIIDYSVEGKNKVFSIKKTLLAKTFMYRAEQYKFTKLILAYPFMAVILDEVLKKCNAQLILLFGSYAKFNAKKESDIDIYVETTDRKVKEVLESENSKISVKIGLFDQENPLIKEIIKNHVVLRGVEEYYKKTKLFG